MTDVMTTPRCRHAMWASPAPAGPANVRRSENARSCRGRAGCLRSVIVTDGPRPAAAGAAWHCNGAAGGRGSSTIPAISPRRRGFFRTGASILCAALMSALEIVGARLSLMARADCSSCGAAHDLAASTLGVAQAMAPSAPCRIDVPAVLANGTACCAASCACCAAICACCAACCAACWAIGTLLLASGPTCRAAKQPERAARYCRLYGVSWSRQTQRPPDVLPRLDTFPANVRPITTSARAAARGSVTRAPPGPWEDSVL